MNEEYIEFKGARSDRHGGSAATLINLRNFSYAQPAFGNRTLVVMTGGKLYVDISYDEFKALITNIEPDEISDPIDVDEVIKARKPLPQSTRDVMKKIKDLDWK